jgi:hypothetical protein
MSTITVLTPVSRVSDSPSSTPSGITMPTDGRIILLDNGKPASMGFMDSLGEALGVLKPQCLIERRSKDVSTRTLTPGEIDVLVDDADWVIAGVGDCGGCSACALHDMAEVRRRGTAASVIVTDAFLSLLRAYGATLGTPDVLTVPVPHPIATRDVDDVRRLARDVSVRLARGAHVGNHAAMA